MLESLKKKWTGLKYIFHTNHGSLFSDVGHTGEVLIIHNISRYCGGQYECQASNNIAQPVHRVMNVEVECKSI